MRLALFAVEGAETYRHPALQQEDLFDIGDRQHPIILPAGIGRPDHRSLDGFGQWSRTYNLGPDGAAELDADFGATIEIFEQASALIAALAAPALAIAVPGGMFYAYYP